MTAVVLQRSVAYFVTRMRQNPGIFTVRILQFAAKAKIFLRELRFRVLRSAFRAVPGGGFGSFFGGDWKAGGGEGGG